jgi:hypothetical protein
MVRQASSTDRTPSPVAPELRVDALTGSGGLNGAKLITAWGESYLYLAPLPPPSTLRSGPPSLSYSLCPLIAHSLCCLVAPRASSSLSALSSWARSRPRGGTAKASESSADKRYARGHLWRCVNCVYPLQVRTGRRDGHLRRQLGLRGRAGLSRGPGRFPHHRRRARPRNSRYALQLMIARPSRCC